MSVSVPKSTIDSFNALLERVATCPITGSNIRRIEMDCPLSVSPLQWLSEQAGYSRYYWADRERHFEMAGIGECEVHIPEKHCSIEQTLKHIRAEITDCDGTPRYYGGFRFHAGATGNDRWRDFKEYRFVLPLLELCRDNGRCYWACNLKNDLDIKDVLQAVEFSEGNSDIVLPAFSDRSDLPGSAEWKALVSRALDTIATNRLQKVVLARQSTFSADSPVDPVALVQLLAARSENVYLFCFEPVAARAFIGASPERLYKCEKRRIFSEALAGTRPRGVTPEREQRYEQELLHSDKEHREHQMVVDDISAMLRGFCSDVEAAAAPAVMKLACCQHLHTPVTGVLADGKEDAALLEAMHPTPAVGGLPRNEAIKWILDNEPFERGIYAAPVGWTSKEDAEFCVGIRSGLVRGNTLTLYAGAGIVAGASPEEEWLELDAKLANFLAIIMKES